MSSNDLLLVVSCAGLWFGGSLLVGTCANQLPLQWLVRESDASPHRGLAAEALANTERWLAIRRWKSWIPDAGDVLPGGIRKADLACRDPKALQRLIAETRRAEFVHWVLWPVWLLTVLWLPPLGVLLNLLFATLFNLPCLLLQRYNRLRLIRLLHRITTSTKAAG